MHDYKSPDDNFEIGDIVLTTTGRVHWELTAWTVMGEAVLRSPMSGRRLVVSKSMLRHWYPGA